MKRTTPWLTFLCGRDARFLLPLLLVAASLIASQALAAAPPA